MKKNILIGLGGFFGSVARYLVQSSETGMNRSAFPVETLLINVIGSFLIAFLAMLALELLDDHPNLNAGATVGFLGAFTTFSAFCKEAFGLVHDGNYFFAALYLAVSAAAGLVAAYAGVFTARRLENIFARLAERSNGESEVR